MQLLSPTYKPLITDPPDIFNLYLKMLSVHIFMDFGRTLAGMVVFITAESGLMVDASIGDDFMADGRIAGWFWIQLF